MRDDELLNELNRNDLDAELARNDRQAERDLRAELARNDRAARAARAVNGFPSWAKGLLGIISILILRYAWGLLLDGLEWAKDSGATILTSSVTILTSLSKVGVFLAWLGLGKYYLLPAYEKYQKARKQSKIASEQVQLAGQDYEISNAELSRVKDECATARGVTRECNATVLRLRSEVSAEKAKMSDILLRLELLQNDIRAHRDTLSQLEAAARRADRQDDFELKIDLKKNDLKAAQEEARPLEEKVANFRSLQASEENARLRLRLAQNDEAEKNNQKNKAESKVARDLRTHRSRMTTKKQAEDDLKPAEFALMKPTIVWLVIAFISWRMA